MKRKMLASILALAMMLTMLPATAWAAEAADSGEAAAEAEPIAPAEEPEEPEQPEAALLQARIDALPEADEVAALMESDPAAVGAVYEEVRALMEAVEALDGALDTARLDALVALFTPEVEPLADAGVACDGTNCNHVAAIGSKHYTSFADAYAAVTSGDTIKVLKDADWNGTKSASVVANKTFILNLNGKTLTLKGSAGKAAYLEVKSGAITVQDTSEGQAGILTSSNTYYLVNLNGGDLTLEGGTLKTSATRTVYVNAAGSNYIMTGGILINDKATGGSNNAVLGINSGTANISGGKIEAIYTTTPCVKMSKAGSLTINGGSFATPADKAIWVNDKAANLNITGGDFTGCDTNATLYIDAATAPSKIQINSDLPKLALGSLAAVTVGDDVTIGNVVPVGDITAFDADNNFGGKYGTDFSQYINGIGYTCEKIENEEYYRVVKLTEDHPSVVAVIQGSDGTTAGIYCDFTAACKALKDGQTLTLKQNVINETDRSFSVAADDVTINLGEYGISAPNVLYGLRLYPGSASTAEDAVVKILGTGTISGKEYGVYADDNGASGYTIDVADTVKIEAQENKVYIETDKARLKCSNVIDATWTNAVVQAVVDGTTYLYNSLSTPTNANVAEVTLIGNHTDSSSITLTNTAPVTVNLNGHTLTCKDQNGIVTNGTALTIENGTIRHTYSNAQKFGTAVGADANGKSGSSLTLENVTLETTGDKTTALTANGQLNGVTVTLDNCTITCTGTGSTVGIYFPVNGGTLNITDTKITAMNALQVKGGTVTVKETAPDKTVIASTGPKAEPGSETSGCTNTGDGIYVEDNYKYKPVVTIESGSVSSANGKALQYYGTDGAQGKIQVTGGYFTSDPGEYVAEGKTAIASDKSGYLFMVGNKEAGTIVEKPATADPEVKLDKIPEEERITVQAAAESVDAAEAIETAAREEELPDAVKTEATAAAEEMEKNKGQEAFIYKQTYLEITPTAYTTDGNTTTLTMDITPVMQAIVSTAKTANGIVLEGDGQNAVEIGTAMPLTIATPSPITVTLPAAFAGQTVYIKHEAASGTYFYTGTAAENGVLTFTSQHGFSPFTFSTVNEAVAQVGSIGYPTFQAAVDAVQEGETVQILKASAEGYSASAEKTVTVENLSGIELQVTCSGETAAIPSAGSHTFTYVAPAPVWPPYVPPIIPVVPAQPAAPASELPFVDVSVQDAFYEAVKYVYDNGLMTGVDTTVFAPYGDFTRAQVATILFRLEAEPVTPFAAIFPDVTEGQWFAQAITWGNSKSILLGYDDGTFGPDNAVTMEQLLTILYRYAGLKGYDTEARADITSFDCADYAAEAVSWAAAHGMVDASNATTLRATAARWQVAQVLSVFCQTVVLR